ncbi:MAG: VWA domain-containing protein [Deltaproteobacteria bacterium]|nr:VWA domain-containing protein [Deltaproteobacteria bacterium]
MVPTRRLASALLATLLAVALAACGPTTSEDEGDGGASHQQDASIIDTAGLEGSIDQPPVNPPCHEQSFLPEKIGDPDIIVLMDMSGSMTEGTPTKYEQTADAVTSVVTQLENDGAPIWWGLLFFPTDNDCAVDAATLIPPAAGNATTISTTINGKSPGGNTPAHKAVQAGTAYYSTLSDDRAHYLLIATDGQPNCDPTAPVIPKTCNPANPVNCTATEICQPIPLLGGICVPADGGPAVAAITDAAAAGIKTYVVGIDIDGTNSTLNMMAEAGGTARAGSTKYYPVSDQASMVSALQSITEQIISCTFALDYTPPDLQYVSVSVGGVGVARDQTHASGWDMDPNAKTLTFYGAACTALQTSPDTVSVIVGCPPVS